MTAQEWIHSGVVNRGNLARLKACMARAANGETLRIGFLGGSITQGSLASSPELCYAWRVFSWWKERFPDTYFEYINGGIGATSSHYGVARVQRDMLDFKPDVVVVDFSVNDAADEFFEETFEGVVRRLLTGSSHPAVIVLNNVFYNDGHNAQAYHNRIGAWYHLPCISMKSAIYPMIESGLYTARQLTPDDLHPNDLGHEYVAGAVRYFLDQVLADPGRCDAELPQPEPTLPEQPQPEPPQLKLPLPEPLTKNAYENSRLYQNDSLCYKAEGFWADTSLKDGMLDLYKNGWTAWREGDKITFELRCSCLAVQYRKSVRHPVPVATAVIDGDTDHPIVLDGNFDEDWGDCLYLETLRHHGMPGVHKLEITITKTHENDVLPFYLAAVIAS